MGSAMAAGVAGLLPARLLQTKALLLPPSVLQPAHFALTDCAVVSSWLLGHPLLCYTLPSTFIEPHIENRPANHIAIAYPAASPPYPAAFSGPKRCVSSRSNKKKMS